MNNSIERITKLVNQLKEINENEVIKSNEKESNMEINECKEKDIVIETGIKELDFEIKTEEVEEIISFNKTSEGEKKKEEEKKEQRFLTITDR
jgi:hypothetical protein